MKKALFLAALLISAALVLAGCAFLDAPVPTPSAAPTPAVSATPAPTPTPTPAYPSISPDEALKLIGTDGVVLLDVRSKTDYDTAHIEGAQSLPLDELVQNIGSVAPDKSTTIIVYCQCGCHSAGAAQTLVNLGYTNVYDLGGLDDWPYEKVPS